MRDVRSEILIQGRAQDVWAVLADFGAYPEWNPFITSISGRLEVGARLRVTIKSPHLPAMKFQPIVQTVDAGLSSSWLGHLYVAGLFDGLHRFEISPASDGVRFIQRERFNGLIVPVSGPILRDTERGFIQMNRALKQRVESGT